MEIWKDVIGYEGLYKVSDSGRVMRISTGRILKSGTCKGYLQVALSKNGEMKSRKINCLVAESFLDENYRGKGLVVNHKDFNKKNNNLSNLEIITQRENANKKHLYSSSTFTGVYFKKDKWVSQIYINGQQTYLGVFDSEIEASRYYNAALHCINIGRPQDIVKKVREPKGYSFSKRAKKWVSKIIINGKPKHLGYFHTEDEAKEAHLKSKNSILLD